MKGKLFVFNSLFVSLILLQSTFCEIRFVFTTFRHGARSPEATVNAEGKDLWGETWALPGELTPIGQRMHYLLGHRNRKRYHRFLEDSFSSKEMYIKSSDYNRTIMSAMSQLQGLYPAGTGPTLNDYQRKIAVPPTNDHGYEQMDERLGDASLNKQVQVFPIHLFDRDKPLTPSSIVLQDAKLCIT